MKEVKLKIEGMSCMHCVGRVKQAISALEGVSEANVEVGGATVKINEATVSAQDIVTAVTKAGYKVAAVL